MDTIAERVARGAAFLDEREPGWWERIDPERLDLASPCLCVLGQLHTHKCGNPVLHYHHARDEYGLEDWSDSDERLGFDAYSYDDDSEAAEYVALTAEWKQVIAERRALAELREALMALPEHRLIEGALCTVGATQRIPEMPDSPWGTNWAREELAASVSRQGEGVCANGAFAWYKKVKAGMDPAEAFASLPVLLDTDTDPVETALVGARAGLTFTLAWELATRNDETFEDMTPEERWTAFVAWIDRELAETASAA